MKKLIQTISIFTLLSGIAFTLQAAPPSKGRTYQPVKTVKEAESLKPGDPIAFYCNQCESISTQKVEHEHQAMELCKADAKVVCPSCQREYRVVRQSAGGKKKHREFTYVNEKGEECLFLLKGNPETN